MSSDVGLTTGELTVTTEENELTLSEMSAALPDTSTIMNRVGDCWWRLIYAARGGNWELAGYYLRRINKLGEMLKVLRPKHRDLFQRFQRTGLPQVSDAVESRDLPGLEKAYSAATDMANTLHESAGYPYVRWVLPGEPPKGLELGPTVPPK